MICCCVPWVKVDPAKKFLPHWMEWYAHNKAKFGLRQHFQIYRPLYEVQEETVGMAQSMGASHVLFVEDDHWGFPINGLDVLLEADKDVIGFQTFRKVWPYSSLAMKQIGDWVNMIGTREELLANNLRLVPHEQDDGDEVQSTDMITWAMTLVKTSVFDRLYEVGKYPFQQQGPVPTDSFFNQYCEDIGIKRHVHFGFGIAHGMHDPADLPRIREIELALSRGKNNDQVAAKLAEPTRYEPSLGEMVDKLAQFKERNAA